MTNFELEAREWNKTMANPTRRAAQDALDTMTPNQLMRDQIREYIQDTNTRMERTEQAIKSLQIQQGNDLKARDEWQRLFDYVMAFEATAPTTVTAIGKLEAGTWTVEQARDE